RPALNFQPPRSIQTMDLWQDELVLVTAQQQHVPVNDPVHIDSLAHENFILFPSALGCGLFEHISSIATAAGFVPKIVQQVRENSTTLALVAAGLGISIVPSIYRNSSPPGVAFRSIAGAQVNSRIVMATAVNRNIPSLELFREYCIDSHHAQMTKPIRS
ncbi:MAG: LysR family substrate-binding domain-containing protein, partial [Advenella sp.]